MNIPWLSVDEGILRLREIAMLEWEHCVKPNPPHWEGPEDTPNHKCYTPQNGEIGASTSEEPCYCSLRCASRVDNTAALSDELNMSLIGPWSSRGQGPTLNY